MKTQKGVVRQIYFAQMEAGHGPASGRDRRYREMAFRYAFLLNLAGIKK